MSTRVRTSLSPAATAAARERFAKLYGEFASLPAIKAAYFPQKDGSSIAIECTRRELEQDTNRRLLLTMHQDSEGYKRSTPFPIELRDAVSRMYPSPSGKYNLCVRKVDPKPGAKSPTFMLDVFDGDSLLFSADTTAAHDKIYAIESNPFGGLEWSTCERFVAYVAEPKAAPTQKPLFGAPPKSASEKEIPLDAPSAFDYKDDWGEQHVGSSTPRLFVLNIAERSIQAVPGIPDSVSAAQVTWSPDSQSLVFVGFPHFHRRFGVAFYNSRPSKLYSINLPSSIVSGSSNTNTDTCSAVCLTPLDHSARCPRFVPGGRWLTYLTTDAVWFHKSSDRLRVMPWPCNCQNPQSRTLVDVVRSVKSLNSFPGLWVSSVVSTPMFCQSSNPDVIGMLLSSGWRSQECVVLVVFNQSTGTTFVRRLEFSGLPANASVTLFDVQCDQASGGVRGLASFSTPTQPETLIQFSLSAPGELQNSDAHVVLAESATTDTSSWSKLHSVASSLSDEGRQLLSGMNFEIQQVRPLLSSVTDSARHIAVSSLNVQGLSDSILKDAAVDSQGVDHDNVADAFETVLIAPKSSAAAVPLILFPHGGPHSQFFTNFSPGVAMMAAAGYAVACVNYRGSTGFGQDFLESLPGKCGRQDVDDCIAAMLQTRLAQCKIDMNQVSVFGGSHGGFLTGHLIGQFPETFCAGVMRNPVLNITWEVGSTDIPDWCYVECGLDYPSPEKQAIPTAADYTIMLEKSPIVHVHKVTAPCLICIGTGDRRVPVHQSIEYIKILRSRQVPARLLSYADAGHGLADKPHTVEADSVVNSLLWIHSHTPSSL